MAGQGKYKPKPDHKPKFIIGQRVTVTGWGGTADSGEIVSLKWIYHIRLNKWTWGYEIVWENNGPGFSFVFIPEGYLRAAHETEEDA